MCVSVQFVKLQLFTYRSSKHSSHYSAPYEYEIDLCRKRPSFYIGRSGRTIFPVLLCSEVMVVLDTTRHD